jgi:sugar O-acyltransferase (sialic acid O-acetyltransferase NeuD family)
VTSKPLPALVLVGGGGHCLSCIDVIESAGHFAIVGYVRGSQDNSNELLGYPTLGTDVDLARLIDIHGSALVTVGQIKTAETRARLYKQLVMLGAKLPVVLSPWAQISRHSTLGEGTIAMHGVVVNAKARVGRNCIINSQAVIEHGTQVGDHCHISTGARINGDVVVGNGCFIGSGAVIKHGIFIGDHALIEAGQVVLADVPSGTWLRSAHEK